MSVGDSLSSHVVWSALPVPYWRRIGRWVPTIVWAVVALVLSLDGPPVMTTLSGPSTSDPRIPKADTELLGSVTVWGRGGGLPAAFPSKQPVSVYVDRATIRPGLIETALPLTALKLDSARRRGPRRRRRKAFDASWEMRVTGQDTDLRMLGPWLLLAHLGNLGDWAEPA